MAVDVLLTISSFVFVFSCSQGPKVGLVERAGQTGISGGSHRHQSAAFYRRQRCGRGRRGRRTGRCGKRTATSGRRSRRNERLSAADPGRQSDVIGAVVGARSGADAHHSHRHFQDSGVASQCRFHVVKANQRRTTCDSCSQLGHQCRGIAH